MTEGDDGKMFMQLFYINLKWMLVIYIVHESVSFGIIHVKVAARFKLLSSLKG